jgi:uncharacterized membrane protein YcaP (DUF421 family)
MDYAELIEFAFIAVRTVIVYLFIISAIRISGKKELSQLSIIDLVFIMLISNSVQNAMVGGWREFRGGLISASALFILNYLLKTLFFKNKSIAKFVQGEPILLIRKGVINKKSMEHERISMTELETAAREHGEADLNKIDLAVLETDGSISIISKDYQHHTNRKRRTSKQLPTSTGN